MNASAAFLRKPAVTDGKAFQSLKHISFKILSDFLGNLDFEVSFFVKKCPHSKLTQSAVFHVFSYTMLTPNPICSHPGHRIFRTIKVERGGKYFSYIRTADSMINLIRKEEFAMKGTVICGQKHPSESFCNGIVLSAIDDKSDIRICDFSVQPKVQSLPRKVESAQISKRWFEENLCKCFSHHPLIASLFLLIVPPIVILLAATFLPALLAFPIGLLLGWL